MAKPFPSAEQGSHKGTGVLPAKPAAPSRCLVPAAQAEQCQSEGKKCSFPKPAPSSSSSSGAPGQPELSPASPVETICAAAHACEAGVTDPAGVTCRCAWLLPARPASRALGGAEWGSAGNRCRNETDRHEAAGRRAPEPGGCALARSLWPCAFISPAYTKGATKMYVKAGETWEPALRQPSLHLLPPTDSQQ